MLEITTKTVLKQIEEVASVTCDLCGTVSTSAYISGDGINWGEGYDILETVVHKASGTSYPDSGDKVLNSWHICPKCFDDKLVPWLKSQGASPTTRKIDW